MLHPPRRPSQTRRGMACAEHYSRHKAKLREAGLAPTRLALRCRIGRLAFVGVRTFYSVEDAAERAHVDRTCIALVGEENVVDEVEYLVQAAC